jgi:D-beta-D-heptose 7-phosphate kinase/D-beta-D-heptose 1-phosphate adenosyltransferase
LLKYAKSLGKILVVGLNSDSSVKEIKGEKRPINNEIERSQLLINIGWVDFVIIFQDNTPYFVLVNLKPDFLVKGGDYNLYQLVGKEFVKEVVLFDYIKGCSTTNIINSIFEK